MARSKSLLRTMAESLHPVFVALSLILRLLPRVFSEFLFAVLRNMPTRLGVAARYVIIRRLARSCGRNVFIGESVFLYFTRELVIADNVSIHPMCYINARGGVTIGTNVSMAHSCSVLSTEHSYDDASGPIKYGEIKFAPVLIESDVWVGCGVRILAGTTIGSRSILAAGCVVTRDVPPSVIVGGVPAKVIKTIVLDPPGAQRSLGEQSVSA